MKGCKKFPRGESGAVLDTILGVINRYGKKYCYLSQEHMLRLLKKYHGIVIARSTLNRWLGWLEDNRWIVRIRRHYKNSCGKLVFRATAYYLGQKALNFWFSMVNRAKKAVSLSRVSYLGQHKFNPYQILRGFRGVVDKFGLLGVQKGAASPVKGIYSLS